MTGTQFQIEMLTDALDYHENGDADDAPCCTAANPCDTRKWVANRLASLGEAVADTNTETAPQPTRSEASGSNTSGRVQSPASYAQVALITKLVASRDVSKIGTFPSRTLAAIQNGKAETVSKTRASSLIDVLQRQPTLAAADVPASPKQLDFLRSLIVRKGYTLHEDKIAKLSRRDVSELIDLLKGLVDQLRKSAPAKAADEGMYRLNGEIYKVQIAVHGSGRPYAKKLVETNGDWEFVVAPGAVYRLTADHKMTLDEAKEFGKLYGACCVCGRTLTDERSIAEGIGPRCGGRV